MLLLLLIFAMQNNTNAQNCSVNANIDFTLCANEPLLLIGQKAGLFYGSGTTTWSQISGPTLNILSPNALTTSVTGHTGNNIYKFRITTKCLDGTLTYDEVTYTVKPITQSNAGPDQAMCPGSPAGLMAGNSVGLNETGSWLVTGTNNGVTVSNSLSPTSSFNLDPAKSGVTKMVWTINNTNSCLSRDTMTIINRGGVSPIFAGADKILTNCYSSTQTTSMLASYGGNGNDGQIGTWTVLSGPSIPTIVNANSNTTNVTGLIEGTYKLLWSVSGPCANGADTVQIIVPPATSNVTSVSINSVPAFCDGRTSTVLTATIPLYTNETGKWVKTSGPSGAIIEDTLNPITMITGLNGSNSYVFRYTITNSLTGCSSNNTTTISYSLPASIDITVDQTILPCGQTFAVIPYTSSGGGNVQWSIISGPKTPSFPTIPTTFANASGSPLTINGLTVSGTYVIRLKKSSGTGPSCNTVYDDVTVVVSANPTGSNSGTKQILACNVTQTALAGNNPYVGIGSWTQVSGPNTATIDSVNKFDSPILNMISGTYKFRWLIAAGPYCSTQQSDVTIVVVSANPSQANAGPDVTSCANTPLYLNGNQPLLNETGTWTVIPSTGISFSDVNSPNAIVNGLAANTTYKFVWKMQNACSFNTDTMIVTTNNITGPIQSIAGPDQCKAAGTTSVTLAGNNPGSSSGTWTKVSGGSATITNSSQYNTTVTGLSNGNYTFEWSIISNGACNPTRDTVTITISSPATTSNAGTDQQICGDNVNLSGNNPLVGTGTWSQLSGNGGAIITDSSINITNVSGLTNGVYNFLWTISNNACPANSDTVKIYVTNPATTPNAGSDFSVCGYDTTSLNANSITVGSGTWSFVSGPNTPTFVNINNPKTKVTGLLTGTYTFKWSSYSGPFCPTNSDNVTVTVVLPANAGNNQSYCDATSAVNLIGTNPSTGSWTQFNGPNTASIITTSSNTATASNLIAGTYIFKYSVDASGCSSNDTMTVNLYAPPTVANAGSDISYCNEDTIKLSGNSPFVGTATWSKLSGPSGGSFKPNSNAPNAIFTASTAGTYVFVYTINNVSCSNADQVIVRNYATPTNANAGFDQNTICNNSTTMSANLPTNGLGNWTFINGPNTPNIVSPILPNTSINNLIPGIYNFEWSISSGICPIKKDTVSINVNEPPTTANAGIDKILCNTPTLNLEGNLAAIGTGKWTQFSGPNTALIADSSNPVTSISNIINGTYIFNWTTSYSPCTSTDQVIITNYQNPDLANSGADINNCLFSPLALNANSPSMGIGQWSQLSGPVTTNILSPNSPNSYILGTVPGNYSFVWTTNNGICNSSKDTVNVVISNIPSMAVAGSDQFLCDVSTINLNGNTPTLGNGTWIQNSGPIVNISDTSNPTSNVINVVPGIYNFTWMTSNNFCTSTDNVNFTVYGQPVSNAGNNQNYCNSNTFNMLADVPNYGTGNWTKISGPNSPVITSLSSPTTSITGVATGTYVFRWTVSNGNCTPVYTDVTIKNSVSSSSNANVSICSSSLPYMWNGTNRTSTGTYTFTTTNAAGCDSVATLNLTVKNTSSSITNESVCSSAMPYMWNGINRATAGTYTYTTTNAAGCDSVATLNLTVKNTSSSISNESVCSSAMPYMWNGINRTAAGTYTYTTTNAAGCDSIATLNLTVKNTSSSITNENICSSAMPYIWNGISRTVAGTYTYTTTNATGCDSVATLNLTVINTSSSLTNESVCSSAMPYMWNGIARSTAGTYTFTTTNAAGCDSIATLNLTVKSLSSSITNETVCSSAMPYVWNGINRTTAGTYTFTTTNAVGCDSIAYLYLTVKNTSSSTTNISVCSNSMPYMWNGVNRITAGTYTYTATNSEGCDSIATLNLTVKDISSSSIDVIICSSALPYLWNGIDRTTSGTYTFTTVNSEGCDSIATLNLTVKNASSSTTNVIICSNAMPYLWNGINRTTAGTYTYLTINSEGCDSVATLTLTVKNTSSSITNVSICSTAMPYMWNGILRTTAGTYTYITINSEGCDSIATLNLIVNYLPIAVNDINITPENITAIGNVLDNDSDPDNDLLTVTGFTVGGNTYLPGTIAIMPGVGTIVINVNGSYSFIPATYWSGVVPSIPYIISDGFCGTATAELQITVTPVPHYIDLGITKKLTDPDPLLNDSIFKNDTVTFTIVLKNNSTVFNATNISVIDTLPLGLSYISSTTTNGSYDNLTGLWTLGNLNAMDSAILTMVVSVDTSAENNVYIIGHSEPDSNLYNNHSFASVSITSTSSGNNGGLESNGNLASKTALRNFIRHKERSSEMYNDPMKLELFSPASVVSSKAKSTLSTDLVSLIPQTGPMGVPAMVSTPTDLIGVSNAIEVVSVDYFDAMKRKAAILGIATNVNTVYEHTKMVCDRLDGASLKSINHVMVKGQPFIIAALIQDNGFTDYSISFIAYKNGNTYMIDNQWDLEQYNPTGNHAVMNFQVWSINENQTIEMVSRILDQMTTLGYNLTYKNTTNSYPKFPGVYIQSGTYKEGNLELNLVNTNSANNLQLTGNRAYVEDGIRYPFTHSTTIATSYNSQISVPSGNIFDIGFSMGNNVSAGKDVLYFADGPWGREFDETGGASISDFSISTQFNPPMSGAFNLGRNANLEGSVKTYASLFRVLRVGNKPINLTNYNKLEFTAFGSGSYEVVISKSSISAWNEQYRTTVNLDNNTPITYQIPFSQFVNAQGQHNFVANDAVSVVFVKTGNNSTYQNFSINVKDMRFTNGTSSINTNGNKSLSFMVYPNPFTTSTNITFNLSKDEKVRIGLYSLEGKLIKDIEHKLYLKGLNTAAVESDELKAGIYFIKLETENSSLFEKVVIIR